MAKIKIEDLPKDIEISEEEMKKVLGGISFPSPLTYQGFQRPPWLERRYASATPIEIP